MKRNKVYKRLSVNVLIKDLLKLDDLSLMWHMLSLPASYTSVILADRRVTQRAAAVLKKNREVESILREMYSVLFRHLEKKNKLQNAIQD